LPTQTSFGSLREFKKWARRKDHERWMREHMTDQLDFMYFVTVTFRFDVSVERAKKMTAKWLRRLRRYLIESWVRVIEVKSRPHAHMLIRLCGDVSAKVLALERRQLRLEVEYGKWICGFGFCRTLRVRRVDKLVEYLLKAWGKGSVKRAVSYSQNIERRPFWLRDTAKAA
jgi:hypothetical protein